MRVANRFGHGGADMNTAPNLRHTADGNCETRGHATMNGWDLRSARGVDCGCGCVNLYLSVMLGLLAISTYEES
jgi:hypothetical protein